MSKKTIVIKCDTCERSFMRDVDKDADPTGFGMICDECRARKLKELEK